MNDGTKKIIQNIAVGDVLSDNNIVTGKMIVETEGVKGIWVLLCFLQAGPLQGQPLLEGVTTNNLPLSLWTT